MLTLLTQMISQVQKRFYLSDPQFLWFGNYGIVIFFVEKFFRHLL